MRKSLIGSTLVSLAFALGAVVVWIYFSERDIPFGGGIPGVTGEGGIIEYGNEVFRGGADETTVYRGTLSQLTVRPVAGASLFTRGDTRIVRFAERGTGHLFEIDVATGVETRIAQTTRAKTTGAVWAGDGSAVALVYETDSGVETFVGVVEKNDAGETGLRGEVLPAGAHSVSFIGTAYDTLAYAVREADGTRGYLRNLKKDDAPLLRFTIPLRDVSVSWEPEILIRTTPTYAQTGYLYDVNLKKKNEGVGLTSLHNPRGPDALLAYTSGSGVDTFLSSGTSTFSLLTKTLPEKCGFAPTKTHALCGVPKEMATLLPDSWYRGEIVFDDILVLIDTETLETTPIADPRETNGRSIDVASLSFGSDNQAILMNKLDSSLWLITLPD